MYYKNTYIRLVIYILLLIAFSGLFFMQAFALSWYSVLLFFGVAWATYHILKLFNKIPQKISYFFNAVENEDSTLRFPIDISHAPTKEMNKSLNRVNSLIQEVKLQNREQEQYYSMLLEQVVTGVVVINSNGNILQANTSAKKLLNY
ncbi:MAG: PAS domain-containing protein, partial [Bacteroidales bacterium]|nr:PAS domain-containing protein [Bacteroidales bacterium]